MNTDRVAQTEFHSCSHFVGYESTSGTRLRAEVIVVKNNVAILSKLRANKK